MSEKSNLVGNSNSDNSDVVCFDGNNFVVQFVGVIRWDAVSDQHQDSLDGDAIRY